MPLALRSSPDAPASQKLFRLAAGRRVPPRVKIAIGGRFMLEDRMEHGGTAVEASLQSMLIEANCRPRIGERVVGYFFSIGRVEGNVTALEGGGFVIEMATTLVKRDKLANQLTWLANREMLNLPEDRRHDRVVPRNPSIAVRNLAQPGEPLMGHLIDVSRSGAAVSIRGPFQRGDEIMLGTTPARVVRAFDGGIAVEFHGPVPDAMFDEGIEL